MFGGYRKSSSRLCQAPCTVKVLKCIACDRLASRLTSRIKWSILQNIYKHVFAYLIHEYVCHNQMLTINRSTCILCISNKFKLYVYE